MKTTLSGPSPALSNETEKSYVFIENPGSLDAAERRASAIRAYWAERGFVVEATVTSEKGIACLRSDMVNGIPRRPLADALVA